MAGSPPDTWRKLAKTLGGALTLGSVRNSTTTVALGAEIRGGSLVILSEILI